MVAMALECAFGAHSSIRKCAHYAQDIFPASVHNTHMGIEWFKARKEDLGLNDADIAALIGRDRSVINKALNGKKGIEPSYIDGLAKALQASKIEILYHAGYLDAMPRIPSESELASMLKSAQDEVGLDGLTLGGYPSAVASGLRARLLRYSGGRPSVHDDASEPSNGHDEVAQSPRSTRRSVQG